MSLYREQFSEAHDFPRVDKPQKILIIASTGRCGSHMLGHALHETGQFGFPLEYANPTNLAQWKRQLGLNEFPELLREIQQRRTSRNGVFAIKFHYPHVKQFGGFRQLVEFFPAAHFVHLSRPDVLRQAVSLAVARQTGVWISHQNESNKAAEYDYDSIADCLKETVFHDACWRYNLAASGVPVLGLSFDEVRNDLRASLQRIARFMNVWLDDSDIPAEPATKRQAGQQNEDWAQQFLCEFNFENDPWDRILTNARSRYGGIWRRIRQSIRRLRNKN